MKMFIGGQRADASDGKTHVVLNSATGVPLDTIPAATVSDIERAIDIAQEGKLRWAATPQYERSRILQRCADLIEERQEELATLLSSDMGKIIRESRPEIRCSAQIFRGFAEQANHLYGKTMPDYQYGSEKDLIFTMHQPLGVVACISPFNYPAELCSHKMASSLAAGNAVIVKPATDNPLIILALVELCLEAGVPGDVLQCVTGSGALIGDHLSKHPHIDAITLTGSTEVGLSVAKAAAGTLKRVFLELGGNDPFIVYEDADMDLAVEEAVRGRVQNAGQTCCAPKRFIVQNSVRAAFVDSVCARLQKVRRGSPLDENTDLGALISARAAQGVEAQVRHTVAQGARLVCGGHVFDNSYFEPTLLDDVTLQMDIARDMEVFGPVMPVIGFDTMQEAIDVANATCFGLQGGVMTRDNKKAFHTASALACGGVCINASGNFRNVDQPFGGWKMSGLGREGISVTLKELTQEKSFILKGVLA
ncbi:MAG: aldehyde dehydrogenase family protein [Oscillospiraceae bacterium]|nr:aldehyde dehydrogenase family protein [Oscillospiraceae bacterium]